MNLDRVTITGADDSVSPRAVLALSQEFPFVEWGILVSPKHLGSPRFPTLAWIDAFLCYAPAGTLLSLHVCGRWVRQLMLGVDELPRYLRARFQRVQLNFHAAKHDAHVEVAAALLRSTSQVIVQMDEVNDVLLYRLREYGVDAVPLYDTSGGAGIVPVAWPLPIGRADGVRYHGYAGGLGPDTLPRELPRIAEAAGDARVWIDMETRVRSDDDRQFDLDKVRAVLMFCAPLITAAAV